MKVKGIVIHNTNAPNKTARELEKWLKDTDTSRGCHFLIDDVETLQVMPLTWSSFNTGGGYDFGNTSCVAVEICTFTSEERYQKAEEKAVEKIKELMKEYGLTTDALFFHRDIMPAINCPAQIIKKYGTKENFIRRYFNG